MKKGLLLAAILLAVSFCFVSGVGYGEIDETLIDRRVSRMEYLLLKAKVEYILRNPTNFLDIDWVYDGGGWNILFGEWPTEIDTEKKIVIKIGDSRNVLSNKSRVVLLELFKKTLEAVYSFIDHIATSMNTDIVAKFYSKGDIPLGYFYQGEYHLWED
ncbi:MAG TPA: hypothetical protein ENI23_04840 [bacterium]|nr:hypothetical protein [bacterium]